MLTVDPLGPRPGAAALVQPEPRVPGLERSGTPGCHGSRQPVKVRGRLSRFTRLSRFEFEAGDIRLFEAGDIRLTAPSASLRLTRALHRCGLHASVVLPDVSPTRNPCLFPPCKDGRVPSCLMAPIRRSARRAPAVRRRGRYWPDGGAPGPSRGCQAPLGARGPGRSGRRPSRPESDGPRGAGPPPGTPLPAEGFRSVPPAAPGWNSPEGGPDHDRATPRICLPCCGIAARARFVSR